MLRLLLTAFLVACCVAGGCTYTSITTGEPLTPTDALQISQGDSKAWVLHTLGAPDNMGRLAGGSWFEYAFSVEDSDQLDLSLLQASASWATTDTRTDRLFVRFDRSGNVTEIGPPRGLGTNLVE